MGGAVGQPVQQLQRHEHRMPCQPVRGGRHELPLADRPGLGPGLVEAVAVEDDLGAERAAVGELDQRGPPGHDDGHPDAEFLAVVGQRQGGIVQQQGQLDMAFDKFRKAPLNEEVMENLYNLGLDFERRRQFNKAESVFRSLHDFDPKFKDVAEKVTRAKQLERQMLLTERLTMAGRLAAGVAHELNNPLATILSWAERLAERPLDGTRR